MRQIKGFPNYFITPNGEVFHKRISRRTKSGDPFYRPVKGYTNRKGFTRFVLYNSSGRYTKYAHNLVMETYGKKIHLHKIVSFKDGDPKNVHIDNLEQVTRSELIQRAKNQKTGLTKRAKRDVRIKPKKYGKKVDVQGGNEKSS